MIFSDLNAICALYERFKGITSRKKEESVAARFVRLFESHGVHRNQISRIFGHDLTPADVANDDNLLKKLTDNMLADACSLFAVRREWLDGASNQIYPIHLFYKNPKGFVAFIAKLKKENVGGSINALLLSPAEHKYGHPALFLLEEELERVSEEKSCYRYHLCSEWIYSYGKCRAFLSAYAATCFFNRIMLFGISAPVRIIQSISDGKKLLGWNGDGCLTIKGKRWHPEDMALFPEIFLDGLDRHSAADALRLWIKLNDQGYMKLGLDNDKEKNARQLFEQELKKYL